MSQDKLICLSGQHSQLILSVEQSMPQILYWGKKIQHTHGAINAHVKPVVQAQLDCTPATPLCLDAASGLFYEPSIAGHRQGTDWSPLFSLDNIQQQDEKDSIQVCFFCSDPCAQLALTITLKLDKQTDMLALSWQLQNNSDMVYQLDHLQVNLILPAIISEIESYGGRWCQEFLPHKQTLNHSKLNWENRRGRTSHQTAPFWLASANQNDAISGTHYGFHFAWSGNFKAQLEHMDDGRVLFQVGELFAPGETQLQTGEHYSTPILYACCGTKGRNSVSHSFHQFIRRQLLRWPAQALRPVHLNTWEGIYFDHQPDYLKSMITASGKLGVERFIVDDGWFKGRNNEHAGLGDWFVDMEKYPDGLQPIRQLVKKQGMQFGLWFEPEMVNPDSELFRHHPDWILKVEGYRAPLGRYQHVLNLQIPEVFNYLLERLKQLVKSLEIDYIKWDMNRDLVQAGSAGRPAYHGQVIACYRLMAELRRSCPLLEIESCASGGGRIDMAVLEHCQRFWTSDCNDPLERVRIQQGFLTFLPPELMGAHIGDTQSHTTGRKHTLDFRAAVALIGHLGLETDPTKLSQLESKQIKEIINLHKSLRSWLHSADSQWVTIPVADHTGCCWMVLDQFSSPDNALLVFFQKAMQRHSFIAPLPMHYLAADKHYQISTLIKPEMAESLTKKNVPWINNPITVSGDWLNQAGLQLPVMPPESALVLHLTASE